MSVVEARDITKTYSIGDRNIRVLENVSLSVSKGDFLVVAGSELMSPLGAYRAVAMGALVVILVLALPNGVMGPFLKRPTNSASSG